jgi:hypothetical protein
MLFAADGDDDLVEVPDIAAARSLALETAGIIAPELHRPPSHRLVGDDNAALQQCQAPSWKALIGSRCMLRVACALQNAAEAGVSRCVRCSNGDRALCQGRHEVLSCRQGEGFRRDEPLDAGANLRLQRRHASAEQVDAGAAVHGPLEGLQFVDLSFSLPVAPRL